MPQGVSISFVPRQGFLAGSVALYSILLKLFRDTRGFRLVFLCQYLSSPEPFISWLTPTEFVTLYLRGTSKLDTMPGTPNA